MVRNLIILSLFGAVFAESYFPSRIVGGEPRTTYMANMELLRWGTTWTQWCGGSLITTRTILSATHCYVGTSTSQWRVRLGSSATSSGGTIHAIAAFILHERYSIPTRYDNDIAIVRLSTPAVLSSSVAVARIAGSNYNLADDTPVTAVGWGALWANGPSAQTLQHVQVSTINQSLCTQRYAYLKTLPGFQYWPDVTANMLCAGVLNQGGRDACQGDSGGPLVHQGDIVIGVTSWGYSWAHDIYPGVYARVANYANWIQANGN